MDGMMKSKKYSKIVCLAVAMMFLFTSIASAAVPAGLYLGGSLNQYISMDYFWANDGENQTEIAALMTEAGLPNVVYVDENQNYVTLDDLAAGTGVLQPLTPDNLDDVLPADGYADIEDPATIIVPSLPVGDDTATAYVDFGALGFTDITVLSTTVDGVAKFQVAGSSNMADLNNAIRILKGASQTEVMITLFANDGTTVLATGSMPFPAADGNVTFSVSAIPVPVDKAALAAAIANAQAKADAAVVGDQPGEYPEAAVDALDAAIADAVAVNEDANATQAEVNAAVNTLNAAVTAFNSAKIPGADSAVADVDFGALGFTDITVTSSTVGAVKFQVAGSSTIADLNSAIRILKGASQTEVLITLLASNGTTVLGTGTLTFPAADATGIVFDVTATPVQTSGTATADVDFGALGFTDIKVTSTDFVGAAKFQVAGSSNVADLNNAIRILKGGSQTTVAITLLDSDGAPVAAGTLTFPAADATGINFAVNAL